MKKDNLIVGKRLWHGSQFFEPGTPVSTIEAETKAVLTEDELKRYADSRFLVDRDEAERARNAEAYDARQSAAAKDATIQQLMARVAELESATPSVGDNSSTGHDLSQLQDRLSAQEVDLTQAQAKINALEEQLTQAQTSGGDATALNTLKTQLQDAQQQRQEAVDALDEQKRLVVEAEMARDEAQTALAEYQQAVGELLPDGLTAPARKALIGKGYVGKTLISLLTDEQLVAVKGVAQTTVDDLREWAPFAGVVPAEGEAAGTVAEAPATPEQ